MVGFLLIKKGKCGQDILYTADKNINIIFVMWGPGNILKSLKHFRIVKLGLELCCFTFAFRLSLSSFTSLFHFSILGPVLPCFSPWVLQWFGVVVQLVPWCSPLGLQCRHRCLQGDLSVSFHGGWVIKLIQFLIIGFNGGWVIKVIQFLIIGL